jgi:hypothetical protein
MEATNDVFRFMAVRPVQRTSELTIANKGISLEDLLANDPRIDLNSLFSVPAPESDFILNSVRDIRFSYSVDITQIDQYLLSKNDRPELNDLVREIENLIKGDNNNISEVVADDRYKEGRLRVAVTLVVLLRNPDGKEDLRALMLRYIRIFALIGYLEARADDTLTPENIFNFLTYSYVLLPDNFPVPAKALARIPGMADLKVVRQKLLRYESGEIAYIENVLKGESRERVHRREDIVEETFLQETERSTETSSDLQSTDRFELNKETSLVVAEDSQLEVGATLSAAYGPVSVTANLGYSTSNSREESTNTSTSYARDVTERASSRIQERTREVRTTRTVKRIEEVNKHGIDNSQGGENVVGIYRWVDKVYEAQVFNYGKRLLLEFVVPEPAAFYKYAIQSKVPAGITLEKPAEPLSEKGTKLSPSDITRENYLDFVGKYFVADVNPPPPEKILISAGWADPVKPEEFTDATRLRKIYKFDQTMKITPGYVAESAVGRI